MYIKKRWTIYHIYIYIKDFGDDFNLQIEETAWTENFTGCFFDFDSMRPISQSSWRSNIVHLYWLGKNFGGSENRKGIGREIVRGEANWQICQHGWHLRRTSRPGVYLSNRRDDSLSVPPFLLSPIFLSLPRFPVLRHLPDNTRDYSRRIASPLTLVSGKTIPPPDPGTINRSIIFQTVPREPPCEMISHANPSLSRKISTMGYKYPNKLYPKLGEMFTLNVRNIKSFIFNCYLFI